MSCANLKSVVFSNSSSVTSIGKGAFSQCGMLQSVTLSEALSVIGEEAFAYCKNLTSVSVPNSVIFLLLQIFIFSRPNFFFSFLFV